MSASAYQRKRRELGQQVSVVRRMNEKGPNDPSVKLPEEGPDAGTIHQEGNPPPYSLSDQHEDGTP